MEIGSYNRTQALILSTLVFISWLSAVTAIDCFKCVSMNGKFPACDDPFHNNHSLQMLESPCMGGRKGRDGLFPATSCIKIAGVFVVGLPRFCSASGMFAVHGPHRLFPRYDACTSLVRRVRDSPNTILAMIAERLDYDTGESITVRGCGLDSGTATTDTEIIRMSHCGRFYYNDRYVHGCLQSCNDADACNVAPEHNTNILATLLLTTISLFVTSS